MTKSFPKIFQLGTKYIKDIFDGEVEITEKVDGSQFNFGKLDGVLWMKSKNKQVFPEAPNMFKLASEYVTSIESIIPDNIIYHCEYLMKPKHNVLNYGRVPRHNLICFGVSKPDDYFCQNYESFADLLDLEVVPVLFRGVLTADDLQSFENFLKIDSILGMVKVEGVVIKNYAKPCFVGDRLLPITCGKYVSEHFKEKHNKDWKNEKGTKNRLMIMMENYRSEARWVKACQALQDAGLLLEDPKDIGPLIRQVHEDIQIEEEQNIKNELYKLFRKDILNKSTAGLPEWYKKRIAWESFKGVDADVSDNGSKGKVVSEDANAKV